MIISPLAYSHRVFRQPFSKQRAEVPPCPDAGIHQRRL